MDRQGCCIVETAAHAPNCCRFMEKTLQFLVLVSLSFLVFILFRKYMFLVCNAILVFLAKNLSFSSSSGIKTAEDGVKQITELTAVLKDESIPEYVAASMEYAINPSHMAVAEEEQTKQHRKQDCRHMNNGAKEMAMEGNILESEEWEEEEEEDDEENKSISAVEEVNDASVSTEELNQKFEEFIRKMKEEISIEAQQQLITV